MTHKERIDWIQSKMADRGEPANLDSSTLELSQKLKEIIKSKGMQFESELIDVYLWLYQSGLDVCTIVSTPLFKDIEMQLLFLSHIAIMEVK